MAWTRRGFLGAALALIGEAVFDPIGKLWHQRPSLHQEILGLRPLGSVDAAAEFDALTQDIATMFGRYLERSKVLVVSDVEFARTLEPGVMRLEDVTDGERDQRGWFEPSRSRLMTTFDPKHVGRRDIPEKIVRQFLSNADPEAYAPITGELRPGEPFDKDTAVALGRCPQTGLMVRVLRFENDAPGSGAGVRLGLEVAGGRWLQARRT